MSYFTDSKFVEELLPSDFDDSESYKLKNKKCCTILFYAPWCKFCKEFKSTWENIGESVISYDIYSFDCEKNSDHLIKIKNELPSLIKSFPSIIVYKNGEPVEIIGRNKDERSYDNILSDILRICHS